jgi:hypothetical protein
MQPMTAASVNLPGMTQHYLNAGLPGDVAERAERHYFESSSR